MQQSYATEDHVVCEQDWIRITFFVINNEVDDEDAAAGVAAAAVPDDAADRMWHVMGGSGTPNRSEERRVRGTTIL